MRVLVLGGAVSGVAAARLAAARGDEVVVYDRRPIELADLEVAGGDWDSAILQGVELVVTSPGFPEHVGAIPDVMAAGLPLVSEMEYANGKTTVTSVAADMLKESGVDASAAGNIGTALSDLVLSPPAVVVIEASSFQLRFIDQFRPVAAALLNIAPDHLDWHTDMAEYIAAKQRIFENQTAADILVFDADDPGAAQAVVIAASRPIPVSGRRIPVGGSGVAGDSLVVAGTRYPRPNLDRAYTMDLVAAGELAAHLGASPAGIGATIARFRPGQHRRTVVGVWNDVAWVNDSKATNPHAAVASVEAYPSVLLIAGGRNKGLDLTPIVAAPTVRRVIGIGEAAPELAAATDGERFIAADGLRDAIDVADSLAVAGDTVLLAPGCASFDMFDSYAARGDEFTKLVLAKKGENGGN